MVLGWEDWVVIGVYFVVVLGTGLGISLCGKKSTGSATDFLLAGRSMTFLPVAFSLFSSNIGSKVFRILTKLFVKSYRVPFCNF